MIDFSNPKDKAIHDHVVELVEQITKIVRQLVAARTQQSRVILERQRDAVQDQLDAVVDGLYDLAEASYLPSPALAPDASISGPAGKMAPNGKTRVK